jgi:hypothetical protein
LLSPLIRIAIVDTDSIYPKVSCVIMKVKSRDMSATDSIISSYLSSPNHILSVVSLLLQQYEIAVYANDKLAKEAEAKSAHDTT